MSFSDGCTQSPFAALESPLRCRTVPTSPALSILGQRTSSGRDRIWQCRREPHGTTSIRGVAMMSVAASSALGSRSRIATIPGANSRKAAHDRLSHAKTPSACAEIMLEQKNRARWRFDDTPSCSSGRRMEQGRALPRWCAIFSGPNLTRIFRSAWNRRPRQGVCRPGKGPHGDKKICSEKSFPRPRSAQRRS
jgi:hypothetical protein